MKKFKYVINNRVRLIINQIARFAPKSANALIQTLAYHRFFHLKNPRYFNEKLIWLMFNRYDGNDEVLACCDKYRVHQYLNEKGFGNITNDLINVWDNPEDIDWGTLPHSFVLKCNYGSGFNVIVEDKNKIDIQKTLLFLKKGLRANNYLEVHMRNMERKIICEKYLGDQYGNTPNDYKFYCFNGEPKVILVILDRYGEKKGAFMSLDWKVVSSLSEEYETLDTNFVPKPNSLDKMIYYARELSKPFPFVRMDFYDVDGKPIFGEFTFTPRGCIHMQETEINGVSMGDLLNVNQ